MINLDTLEEVVQIIKDQPISEITINDGTQKITLKNSAVSMQRHSDEQAEVAAEARELAIVDAEPEPIVDRSVLVSAPLVGTFHNAVPPLRVGSDVRRDAIVGTIDSLKIINDVRAVETGRIVEVLIEDRSPVEYGQPLFRIAPQQ